MRKLTLITLFLAFILVPGLGAANIVLNPSFETGSFSPWVQSGDTSFTGVNTGSALSGSYGAYFGPTGSFGYITQTLATAPGVTYDLSFWIWDSSGYGFGVWWAGNQVYSEGNVGSYDWTQRQFTVAASGASTDLTFGFFNPPSYYYFDDVSVEQVAGGVPEPTSLVLAGLGLAVLAAFRRRK